jgi:hypothetical protein
MKFGDEILIDWSIYYEAKETVPLQKAYKIDHRSFRQLADDVNIIFIY